VERNEPDTTAQALALADADHVRVVAAARRIVIKVGSSLVTDEGRGLDRAAISRWGAEIASLRAGGKQVVVVSSGAVAEGMKRLGWRQRPREMHELQAAAAVGQMGLAQVYESCFAEHGLRTAQVLLTHEDLADRKRYLNARSTLRTLLELAVVPIINENDTVVTDEIKFGDNDTLGALVTNLIDADALVILTDQQGLFTADPRSDPSATLLAAVRAGDPRLEAIAGGTGSSIARGGMITKVRALCAAGRSLLPIGVTEVQGDYERGEVIAIRNAQGIELGRGLSNYSSADTRRIMRRASHEIESILGYIEEPELIHRDDLVLR